MRVLAAVLLLACTSARTPPGRLSETGLYDEIATRTLADDVMPFRPAYELWSDGAEKRRWIRLPAGTRIDTSDPNHWRFPPGTRVWKEFRRGDRLLETRLIEIREGQEAWMGSFVWDADGGDAVLREGGAQDVHGTGHDVPAASRCASCHGGEPGRVLGFSAVQLAGGTPTVVELASRGLTSHPVPTRGAPHPALGYLHANCGHCHSSAGIAFRETDLVLRLEVGDDTAVRRTTVGAAMQRAGEGPSVRVHPGGPDSSGLLARMRSLDARTRMPPLGTEQVDATGVRTVLRWIESLRDREISGSVPR